MAEKEKRKFSTMKCTMKWFVPSSLFYNPRISNSHTYLGPAYGEQIYPINLLNTNWVCLQIAC